MNAGTLFTIAGFLVNVKEKINLPISIMIALIICIIVFSCISEIIRLLRNKPSENTDPAPTPETLVDVKKKICFAILKMIVSLICILVFYFVVLPLSSDKPSEVIESTPPPEASEYILPVDPTPAPTPEPTSEPTPDPTPESTPEPTHPRYLNVQCQNDPSFTDFYIELTSPDGQQPNYYFSSDLPVLLPDASGTYSILVFRLTGELLYGNSTYIHDFADGWDVYFPYEVPET